MSEPASPRTRKRRRAEFKAQVVVATLREDKTLDQLGAEHGVHPGALSDWKQQALWALPGVFGQRQERDAQAVAARERELFEQIGRLEMELCWLKKSSALGVEARRALIDPQDQLSVRQQCRRLGLNRSALHDAPVGPSAEETALCHPLVELYTADPFDGVRRMTEAWRREGRTIHPKGVRRLLRAMGRWAVYPKPRLSRPGPGGTGRLLPGSGRIRGLIIAQAASQDQDLRGQPSQRLAHPDLDSTDRDAHLETPPAPEPVGLVVVQSGGAAAAAHEPLCASGLVGLARPALCAAPAGRCPAAGQLGLCVI